MPQVYNIPNTPIYSPLAGLSELYGMYLKDAHQKEQDAYTREKDNRDFGLKDKELADSARRTQSTIDYYNGKLALDADINSATNQIAMMNAKSAATSAGAAQTNAGVNAARERRKLNTYNDEMRLMNSALVNLGGNGQPGAQTPLDPEVASLYQNLARLRAYMGGQ